MKKIIAFVAVGVAAFTGYTIYAWITVSPADAQTLGQFGDAFGVCTSLLTFLALVGLGLQIRQTERQHMAECDQQAKEHRDEMDALQKQHNESLADQKRQHMESLELQRKNHRDAMVTLQKQHDENLEEQKRQHAESLELQWKNHREEIEIQRMGFLSAEHPLIQANPCAVMMFPIEQKTTTAGKSSYLLVWQFTQRGKVVPRNPVFACVLTDASHKALGCGRCRPGQLPYSQSDMYEVVFPLVNIDPITENTNCSITVLFQNSLGGCFKYSETNCFSELRINTKPIPEKLLDEALSELVTRCHSISKFFMSKGFCGKTFIRTNQPICDVPLTNTEFQKEMQEVSDITYCDSIAICQGIIDEQRLGRELTEFLKSSI